MSRSGGRDPRLDRIKRPEERLLGRLEGSRLDEAGDQDGRAALFTHGRISGSHTVQVHCSRCGEASPVDLAAALRSVRPLFLFAPWRDHPVFAVCPACRHRAWLRPTLAS